MHECATAIGLSQPATSQHLAWLRRAGLVTVRRDKTAMYYSFNRDTPMIVYELVKFGGDA